MNTRFCFLIFLTKHLDCKLLVNRYKLASLRLKFKVSRFKANSDDGVLKRPDSLPYESSHDKPASLYVTSKVKNATYKMVTALFTLIPFGILMESGHRQATPRVLSRVTKIYFSL